MITYAQNFEDVMLERLFKGQSAGFYIDVGAWHPTLHSVTRHFYDAGWRGVNIEPIRRQYELFVQDRPRDINLNAALVESSGTLNFFECEDNTALSTGDPEQAQRLRSEGHAIREYSVQALTLSDVTERIGAQLVGFNSKL